MVNRDVHVMVAFEFVHRMLIVMYSVAYAMMMLTVYANNDFPYDNALLVHVRNVFAANNLTDLDYMVVVVVDVGMLIVFGVVDSAVDYCDCDGISVQTMLILLFVFLVVVVVFVWFIILPKKKNKNNLQNN